MKKAGSPIKQAALLRQAIAALNGIDEEEAMHIGFAVAGGDRKRSAGLVFATFSAGWHPIGLDEEGLEHARASLAIPPQCQSAEWSAVSPP